MICNTCGRHTQNETANFCEYCGASFREQAQGISYPNTGQQFNNRTILPGPPMGNPMAQPQPMQQPVQQPDIDKPISFLNWLGTYVLLIIPFANIIMLFIWAFSYNTPVSKRNWARVTLIAFAVLFLLYLVLVGIAMSMPEYQQMYQQLLEQYSSGVK